MDTILLTGGSGFFGSILKQRILNDGYKCLNIDIEDDELTHPNLVSIKGNILDEHLLKSVCREHKPVAIMHVAALLTHAVKDQAFLYNNNVESTRRVAEAAAAEGVHKVIFASSNALFGGASKDRLIVEDDEPKPAEEYGQSKLDSETILLSYSDKFHSVVFRCPNIMDAGRLGLLAILFAFIDEGRKVWVVGDGNVRHQCVYAGDVASAFMMALNYDRTNIFNIGSDDVSTFKEMFEFVVSNSNTGARVRQFPKSIAILAMKLSYVLKISPLGQYQYRMLVEPFEFNTARIKKELGWSPTLTNKDILDKAYNYYHDNKIEILNRKNVSAHKQPAKMGVIRVLKFFS